MSASKQQSGIEWIGLVPSHWKIVPFKFCYTSSNAGEVIDKSHWHYGNELLYTCQRTPMKSSFSEFPLIKRTTSNDLLLTRNGTPYVHLPINNSIYSNVVQRVKLNRDINREYAGYMLGSAAKQLRGFGDIIESFNMGTWNGTIFLIPPINEQLHLVRYIGNKTTLIDSKISNLEKLFLLLEEKRSTLITNAVTKGLNLDVSMKDTSVEWLSEIPVHWQDGIVKRFYKVDLGKMLDSKKQTGDYKPYLRAANIHWDEIKLDNVNQMGFTKKQQSHYRLKKGDLLVTEGGHTVGRSAIWYEDSECYFQNSLNRVRAKSSSEEKYLHYIMFHLKLSGYVNMISDSATFAHLTKEKLEALTIPMPPIEEQKKIIFYLDDFCKKVDSSKLIIEKQIAHLREFRTELISAVVTGKIDVRSL